MFERGLELVVTVLWAGRSPVAPGTAGALVAIPVAWAMHDLAWTWKAVLLGLLSLLGVAAVNAYLRRGATAGTTRTDGDHGGARRGAACDPSEVVIDELAGCLIALAFVPWRLPWVAAAFLLFRLLDILKPGPIRTIDRRTTSGWGVMGDDVVAGLAAGLLLAGLRWLLS